jgi:hypothetical protein
MDDRGEKLARITGLSFGLLEFLMLGLTILDKLQQQSATRWNLGGCFAKATSSSANNVLVRNSLGNGWPWLLLWA